LENRLAEIRKQRDALQIEGNMLAEESATLDKFETRFWEDYQDFSLKFRKLSQQHGKIKQKIRVQTNLLNRLKRTNVFDDAFHISYDGHFGTINGFRLGRLPSQPVDWTETNAGLGQVILLLHTVAKHANFAFSKCKLIPMGSFSKVGQLRPEDPAQLKEIYELYGSNDLSLGRLFWYRRFDSGLIWLLFCIKELGDHAAKFNDKFKNRYKIDKDVIGGVSVKVQFNRDTDWTKALKYMLTNLKFVLIWAATLHK